MMAKKVFLGILTAIGFVVPIGALLFACAGRWDLPLYWAYLGVWAAAVLAGSIVADPTLARERLRPGPGGKDYLTVFVLTPFWLGQYVVASLDVGRFHWSDSVPPLVQVIGLLATIAALTVQIWAVAVNRFFSSVIRIQTDRGHHLVTGGPYRFVRHPAYASAPFLLVGSGLVLGSWLAAAIGLLMFFLILPRTIREDRILREQLEGYVAYAQQVRYRLFPGVW
jgi:protein-S-isoprenylcysteine O-methyltransferase Ste14